MNGEKFEKLTIEPRLLSNNYGVIEKAAISGAGITFMPRFLVKESVKAGLLKPIFSDWHSVEIPIHLVFPNQRFISTKLRTFIDFIVIEVSKSFQKN